MKVCFPARLEELWDLWRQYPDATFMAGGTDLLVKVAHRGLKPQTIICLEKVAALRKITREATAIMIGAAVTHQSLLDDRSVQKELPLLWKAISVLGSPPIRHTGTIGGNICTASPAGDTLPALYVLEAQVEIWGADGKRLLPIGDFITGPGRTALRQGEILGRVIIPLKWAGVKCGFYKLGHRKALAIAVASLAALWRLDDGGILTQIKLAWGSVGPQVQVFPEVEKALLGHPLTEKGLQEAKKMIAQGLTPIDDLRATAAYRRQVAGNLLLKVLD